MEKSIMENWGQAVEYVEYTLWTIPETKSVLRTCSYTTILPPGFRNPYSALAVSPGAGNEQRTWIEITVSMLSFSIPYSLSFS